MSILLQACSSGALLVSLFGMICLIISIMGVANKPSALKSYRWAYGKTLDGEFYAGINAIYITADAESDVYKYEDISGRCDFCQSCESGASITTIMLGLSCLSGLVCIGLCLASLRSDNLHKTSGISALVVIVFTSTALGLAQDCLNAIKSGSTLHAEESFQIGQIAAILALVAWGIVLILQIVAAKVCEGSLDFAKRSAAVYAANDDLEFEDEQPNQKESEGFGIDA
jgi:hypothetical protein